MKIPTITKKQQTILHHIYTFRFLNRTQIQTLFNHKSHSRITTWLKDLTDKNYLGRIENPNTSVNHTPTIYYLKNNGIRYLKNQDYAQIDYLSKLYQEKNRSQKFTNECMMITDCYIDLKKKDNHNELQFYTRSEYSPDGIIREIFPFFVFRKGKDQKYFIVEIFPEKPRFFIRKRIRDYITFFTKSDWTKQEESPTILFICPNVEIEEYISRKTQLTMQELEIDIAIKTTTKQQIEETGITADIWNDIEVE